MGKMKEHMENEQLDAALILEDELKRRCNEIVERVVVNMVGKIIHEELNKYKAEMMLEISIAIGKSLQVVENEGRKPLWEATPEEFGLTHEELNTHSMTPIRNAYNNLGASDAIREQTPSV
jgi:hypothetical protein